MDEEPQPLTPEELAELREGLDDGSFHEINHETWYRGLLATIDKLQAEKTESDARLAAICDDAALGEKAKENEGTCGTEVDHWRFGALHVAALVRKAISGGKQNG